MTQKPLSIGLQLRALVARSGLTLAQLSKAMGYSGASSVQRYLAPEYGETGTLPPIYATRFAKALEGHGSPAITAAEVYALSGAELSERGAMQIITLSPRYETSVVDQAHQHRIPQGGEDLPFANTMPRDLPVYGTALGGELVMLDSNANQITVDQMDLHLSAAIDYLRRPAALRERGSAYALIVAGDSMAPRFRDGETVIVDPQRQASVGQDVIVQLRDGNGHDGDEQVVAALVKTLVRRSATWVELEQYNPPLRFRVETARIAAVHRIVPIGEMLGL